MSDDYFAKMMRDQQELEECRWMNKQASGLKAFILSVETDPPFGVSRAETVDLLMGEIRSLRRERDELRRVVERPITVNVNVSQTPVDAADDPIVSHRVYGAEEGQRKIDALIKKEEQHAAMLKAIYEAVK